MCFSTEASFTAAALLGFIGYATLREVKEKREIPFALVPLLFGVQQFFEGILWVTLTNGTYPNLLGLTAEYLYLLIAFVTWPLFLPFGIWCMEKDPQRKRGILACLIVGLFFVAFNVWLTYGQKIEVNVVGRSIQYSAYSMASWPLFATLRLSYLIAILLPTLISTRPRIKLFGIGVAAAYVLTEFIYFNTFTSVWCFFSAMASALIFIVLRDKTRYPAS